MQADTEQGEGGGGGEGGGPSRSLHIGIAGFGRKDFLARGTH
jgi:hypothetical protein